ncbi:DNA-binding protein, partial [Halomonas sp. BBD48]|nr:DNA-binding protein [Halomonas sp. BBD48]
MARSGVQYDDVRRAIDRLLQQGEAPSVQKIREVLGTGS